MTRLSNLSNTARSKKRRQRVGRGPSSGVGKTCGRGIKGAGSRSGYRRRYTYEGGQMRLFRKLPCRGFSRARFQKPHAVINLRQIDRYFSDGDSVTNSTLYEKGLIPNLGIPVKLLGMGEAKKKLAKIELHSVSTSAREKLEKAKIPFQTTVKKGKESAEGDE